MRGTAPGLAKSKVRHISDPAQPEWRSCRGGPEPEKDSGPPRLGGPRRLCRRDDLVREVAYLPYSAKTLPVSSSVLSSLSTQAWPPPAPYSSWSPRTSEASSGEPSSSWVRVREQTLSSSF